MNRLETRLAASKHAGTRGLAPFVMAGDGGLETTLAVLRALDACNVACIEIGLPFSDPIADGPVLQAAADRALAAGATFERMLSMLAAFRSGDARASACHTPIVIMSYSNPLFVRGFERSVRALAAAGADGLIVPDLPLEESADTARDTRAAGLASIFFVAPTTSADRAARAIEASRGFLYAIGRFGVTGASTQLDGEAQRFLQRVRALAGALPVAVGFGIDDADKVRAAVEHADLAIVGSALVQRIHESTRKTNVDSATNAAHAARDFVRELERGLPR